MPRVPPPSRSPASIPTTMRACPRRRFWRWVRRARVPGSLGVVQGDGKSRTSRKPWQSSSENAANWIDRDPELKCYLPGTPRAMYMPHPFQITQSTNKIHMAFSYSNTARTIHLDKVEAPPDNTWMGHSVGRWEGDTLVVDVTNFNDRAWFDRAGNYHSDALHLTERFTMIVARRHLVRSDDRRPERLYAAVDDRDAALSARGTEHAAARIPLQRIRRGVHVRKSPQGTIGQALGGRDDDDRHHPQDTARRRASTIITASDGVGHDDAGGENDAHQVCR